MVNKANGWEIKFMHFNYGKKKPGDQIISSSSKCYSAEQLFLPQKKFNKGQKLIKSTAAGKMHRKALFDCCFSSLTYAAKR